MFTDKLSLCDMTAIYRNTTKILNGKLQDHEEQLETRLNEEKKKTDEAASASTSRVRIYLFQV